MKFEDLLHRLVIDIMAVGISSVLLGAREIGVDRDIVLLADIHEHVKVFPSQGERNTFSLPETVLHLSVLLDVLALALPEEADPVDDLFVQDGELDAQGVKVQGVLSVLFNGQPLPKLEDFVFGGVLHGVDSFKGRVKSFEVFLLEAVLVAYWVR